MSTDEEKRSNEQYSRNFTRIPNVLFIAYTDITKEEKYLYADLRRVYWDMKPRFVSLRELSNATKYSISALSKMLPRLHDAGLIHAEIRREKAKNGREKGNPKYHITIVDIWEVNRMFFSCSQKEQVELAEVPSAQLVHEIEQACSRNNTSLFTKTNNPDMFGEQDQAQIERAKDNNKDTSKDLSKESNGVSGDNTSLSPEVQTLLLKMQEKIAILEVELSTTREQLSTSIAQAQEHTTGKASKQVPIADVTTQPSLLPPDETPKSSQSEKGKGKSKETQPPKEAKPRQSLTEPEESMEWGVEKAMAWANYFRGFAWPVKKHANSKHVKALESAELVIQRGITEKKFVYVFKYMKGLLPNGVKSDYWSDKEVDIWTVNDHYENQKTEINRKRDERLQAAGKSTSDSQSMEQLINPNRVFSNGLSYFPSVFTSNTLVAMGGK